MVADGVLLFIAFFMVYYVKRGDVLLAPSYHSYLAVYFFGWLFATLVTGKCSDHVRISFYDRLKPFAISATIHLVAISIVLVFLKSFELSRFVVYGSIAAFFMLEIIIISGLVFQFFSDDNVLLEQEMSGTVSPALFTVEIVSVIIFYFAVYFFKNGTINISEDYRMLLAVVLFIWFFVELWVHRFRINLTTGYLKAVWPLVKSNFILAGITTFFIYGFQVFDYSRLVVFGILLYIALFEIISVTSITFH